MEIQLQQQTPAPKALLLHAEGWSYMTTCSASDSGSPGKLIGKLSQGAYQDFATTCNYPDFLPGWQLLHQWSWPAAPGLSRGRLSQVECVWLPTLLEEPHPEQPLARALHCQQPPAGPMPLAHLVHPLCAHTGDVAQSGVQLALPAQHVSTYK